MDIGSVQGTDWQQTSLALAELAVGRFSGTNTIALRPVIGWAILDTGEKPDAADINRYEKHQEKTSGGD